jgi:hypothetical protein
VKALLSADIIIGELREKLAGVAKAEGFTDRFISRMMRLAYLSPDVLERLVISRDPSSVSRFTIGKTRQIERSVDLPLGAAVLPGRRIALHHAHHGF